MSVLVVVKSDLRPEMAAAWPDYAKVNIPLSLTIPGLDELRVYRTVAGSSFAVATYEFADLAAYAAWRTHGDRTYLAGITSVFGEHLGGNMGTFADSAHAIASSVDEQKCQR